MAASKDRKRFEEIEARLAEGKSDGPDPGETTKEIRKAIWGLRDELVAKYQDYHGRDWRSKISHLMEQAGSSLHSDIEQEKQDVRDAAIMAERKKSLTG